MTVYKVCRTVGGTFRSFSTKERGFDLAYRLHEYTIPELGPVWVFKTIGAAVVFAHTYMDCSRYVLLRGEADTITMKQPVFSNWSSLRDYYTGSPGSIFASGPDLYATTDRFMPTQVICALSDWSKT